MSILDKLKNLPEELIDAIKQASSSEGADIRIEKTIASGVEITIKVRSRAEELDLEGLSLADLYDLLEELEQKLDIVEADEPEDEDSDAYEEWEDMVDDLEDQIDAVQEAIDDLEDECED